MADFNRDFPANELSDWLTDHRQPNIVTSLFQRWAFPGEQIDSRRMLRLAVRDKYLNFYYRGQSVAKLALSKKVPKVLVHRKYVEADQAEDYCAFAGEALVISDADAKVNRWVNNAKAHVCVEKAFVDDLVGANSGVIDLEMALSVERVSGKGAYAPRMDIVVAQTDGDRSPVIAFWEAKCADNAGLRSSKDFQKSPEGLQISGPKVIGQTDQYEHWFDDRREARVIGAYAKAVQIMSNLLVHADLSHEPACQNVWEQLSNATARTLLRRPGIVVGNYAVDVGKDDPRRSNRMPAIAKSFDKHRAVLEGAGLVVHQVGAGVSPGAGHSDLKLPALSASGL